MKTYGVLWSQYGPYHFARVRGLVNAASGNRIHALELAGRTRDYRWERAENAVAVNTICPDALAEEVSFSEVFRRARRVFRKLEIGTCLLPSYSPKQSLAALLAAKSLGIRTVMMNESHAGTARSGKFGTLLKRQLVGLFDAALVGGAPQKRYYASLGMPANRIFTGYNAVDNDHFAAKSVAARSRAFEHRSQYELPDRYFLSLGRFVAKKNLATLVRAYALFLKSALHRSPSLFRIPHLVLVGSGEEEPGLLALCSELGLPIYDKRSASPSSPLPPGPSADLPPGVHFYGFRQVDENPIFYALADAFVLPSLWEEWGLVVNEAMASGLPVIVSETAGCAEDLLEPGLPPVTDPAEAFPSRQPSSLRGKVRRNGFVFDPASISELAAILAIVSMNPALGRAMGGQSRITVEKCSCENFGRNALRAIEVAAGRSAEPLRGRTAGELTSPRA